MRSVVWRRAPLAAMLMVAAGFCVGCNPESTRSEYDHGVVFDGAGKEIYKVEWWRPKGAKEPCPLAVRLEDGTELDVTQFASPKLMRDLGGRVRNRNGERYDIMVQKSGATFWSYYEKGELVAVGVNMNGGRRHSNKITFDGKTVMLPTSESDLFKQAGDPRSFRRWKGFP